MNTLNRLVKRLLAYLPTQLPTGMAELNQWLDDIVDLVGPIADEESIHYVAGHECIALKNTVNKISKMNVVNRVKKFAFNQCMSKVLQDISTKHEAAKIAANKQPEDTPPVKTTSADEKTQPSVSGK